MLKFFGLLLILLGISIASQAESLSERSSNLSYFEQVEYISFKENLSLNQIRQIPSHLWKKSYSENINFGFTEDHYWFRITLKNIQPSAKTWYLRSKYPLLDHIDLYSFSGNALIEEFHSGDSFPFSQRPIEELSFTFPISIATSNPHVIYMHVQTTSSLQLSLSLQDESDFRQTVGAENTIRAAFYSVLICMLIYNMVIFLIVRVSNHLYYVMYLGSFILLMASTHGVAYRYLWPNSPEINQASIAFITGIVVSTAIIFMNKFLHLKEIRPNIKKFLTRIAILTFISSLISVFAPYSITIQIITTLGLITVLTVLFTTFQEWFKQRNREILIFIIAWSAILMGYILFIGQKFGVLPVNNFTEHSVEIGAILEALLLALGLADRINKERKTRIQTQEYMIKYQQKLNIELDNKVRERTDELEIINNKLQQESITDSLTQIRNRNYFDYKFSIEYRRSHRDKNSISLLILDIDHFKKINDVYGHQAGDEVLRKIAHSIQSCVNRPSDSVFRYGGEEFTVLLPNTDKSGAFLVAEHIRKIVEATKIEWENKQLSVTISIGLASCIPIHVEGGVTLLKKADDYLYAAKSNGRNQVVSEDNDPDT